MAFWSRISRFKLRHYSYQIHRYYLAIPNGASINSNTSLTSPCSVQKPYWAIRSGHPSFFDNVRFFAAPVQVASKEEKDTSGPRMNVEITAPIIRLVTEQGHEIVSRNEALARARRHNLDLVEVQRKADPPVCKLMDFHKEKYKQQLKEKDRAKAKADLSLRKGDCKEVRFSGKTDLKDLKMKADQMIKLMERGYRVKCIIKGKVGQDLGGLLNQLAALIEDVAVVESGPSVKEVVRRETVREAVAHVIVRHVKFGAPKKGSGKQLKLAAAQIAEAQVQSASTASAAVDSTPVAEEEILSDEDDLPDFTEANPVSSSPKGPSLAQNRYKGSEPRNQIQPTKRTDNSGPVPRHSSRPEPQFLNQRRQPPVDVNSSPSVVGGRKVGGDASANGSLKPPPNNMREPRPPVAPSSRSSFGIFSSSNAPGKAEVPRQREGNPGNPGARGDSQKPGLDKGGTKSFGIFSRESSNVAPNRTTKRN